MMLKSNFLLRISALAIFSTIISCSEDDNYQVHSEIDLDSKLISIYGDTEVLILPSETDLAKIPSDPNNPLTSEKVSLGKMLFHETGLALNPNKELGENTYSCASCHHAGAGFQSGNLQGIGEGGFGFGLTGEARTMLPDYLEEDLDVQPIKSPTVLNAAYQKNMLWNGQFGATGVNIGTEDKWTVDTPKEKNNLGFEGVETQAIAGIGVHRLVIDKGFLESNGYITLFDAAFNDIPANERYTTITAGLAIAAYERTILANNAPFQNWLKGDKAAITRKELKGANLFYGKANCYSCHSGPALNNMEFYALGMNDLDENLSHITIDEGTKKGRGGFTGNSDDDYKFKTPSLYNLKDVTNFGHGGSFTSVRAVIEYKNKAIPENSIVPKNQISERFVPLNLTEEEIDELTAFVENALYDNALFRYAPENLPSGNCFPNADSKSKEDMNCD